MADRVTKLTLLAEVGKYISNVEKSAKATKNAADDIEDASKRQGAALDKSGKAAGDAAEKTTKASKDQKDATEQAAKSAEAASEVVEKSADRQSEAVGEAADSARKSAEAIEESSKRQGDAQELTAAQIKKAAKEAEAEAKRAAKEVEQSAKKAAKEQADAAKAAEQALKKQRDAMTEVGGAMLIAGGALAAGIALAVSKYAEFDSAMSNVQASTHESAENMGILRNAALDAGAKTVFSATEAANAIDELAKAGVSTADVVGGALAGSLDLASAGGLGVADAAAIAATAMTQFGKSGSEVPHIADLLAAGAGKAQGSVEELGMALKQGGLVASQAGFSIEETTGTLAAFASAGLIGSDAGTSLKTAILALQNPSEKASGLMAEYGISVYDAQGKMLGMTDIAGQLERAFVGKTDAERDSTLATIFGSDAVRAASVLYKEGAGGIQEWIDKTNDSGYAAETARAKLDNLNGDIEALGGAFDTAMIKIGSSADGPLRTVTQMAADMISAFADAPEGIQTTALVLGAVTAAALIAGGAFMVAVPKIAAMKQAMADLDLSGKKVASGFGKGGAIALGLAAIAGAASAASNEIVLSADKLSNFKNALSTGDMSQIDDQFKSITGSTVGFKGALEDLYSSDFSKNNGVGIAIAGSLKAITFGLVNLGAASDEQRAKFAAMGRQLTELGKVDFTSATGQFNKWAEAAGGGDEAIRMLLNSMPDYKAALTDLLTENGRAATEQELFALATGNSDLSLQAVTGTTATATGATAELTAGIEQQTAMSEEAAKALEDWRTEMADIDAGFVSIGGTLTALTDKQRAYAEDTASATESTTDSWKDYYDGVSFSMDEYLNDLQAQVDAQTNWEANMISLAGRVSQGTLDALARLGPEGAPLVASLVNSSAEEIARFEGLFQEGAGKGTAMFAATLQNAGPVIAAAGAQLGQGAASEIARKLADGTSTVEQIVREYGLKVESVNPTVNVNTSGAFAKLDFLKKAIDGVSGSGGYSSTGLPGYAYADGGTIFGPGTAASDTAGLYALSNGEEVISNKKGQAAQNRALLKAINSGASRHQLMRGLVIGAYADGGTAGVKQSPYDVSAWSQYNRKSYVPGPDSGAGAVAAAISRGAGMTFNQTVMPQPRQSEREIGQASADWMAVRMRSLI